jgi:hypothetical protein
MLRISSFKAFVVSNLLQIILSIAIGPTPLSVILSSLIAGFIAGCIAEYRPVLHGALSGCFWLILTLYAAPTSLSLIVAFAALLAGALGGYGAAQLGSGASRYSVAPVSRTGFLEGGLVVKFLLSLIATVSICTFIFFSPTIFCHGGGAGGNCGEGYMASIPIALLLSPFIFAAAVFLV